MSEVCENCQFWNNPNHPQEMFKFIWGMYWYNVDEAYQLIASRKKNRTPENILVSHVSGLVDYPAEQDTMDLSKRYVDVEHLDHVDVNKPILFARYPSTMILQDSKLKEKLLLIDGTHRIARAIRDGHPVIQAYFLTKSETEKVLTDNSGKKPKKKK